MRVAIAFVLVALAACGPQDRTAPPAPREPGLMIADSVCAQIIGAAPPEAREDGWTIVTRDELTDTDRANWQTYHSVECPGLAEDEWNGDGRAEYAVTSVQMRDGAMIQKLVLLRHSDNGYVAQTLWGPSVVESARTVFISSVPNDRETPPLQYPAFILAQSEVFAVAFYEEEGEVRTLPIRDREAE